MFGGGGGGGGGDGELSTDDNDNNDRKYWDKTSATQNGRVNREDGSNSITSGHHVAWTMVVMS